MKQVAIIPNMNRDLEGVFTKTIVARLDALGVEHVIVKGSRKIPKTAEMVIVLGGDGTILRCAARPDLDGRPILGINAGHLGFLTGLNGISSADMRTFDRIIEGKYDVSERLMLEVEFGNKHYLALNDVYLHAKDNEAVRISVSVNDKYLKTYHGDGVIVATSSGSTAYSLSAGSIPIDPEISAILLTPICPIDIGLKSFAVSADKTLMLEFSSLDNTRNNTRGGIRDNTQGGAQAILTIDGRKLTDKIVANEHVFVRRAKCTAKLVQPKNGIDFLSRVREKMCEHVDTGSNK